MEDSDGAVVWRVREGDRDAFCALVERHSHALFRLAYRMTGNEHDAEDVVQETFLRAFRHLNRFKLDASFAAWVRRIAVNCSINLLHKRPPQIETSQTDTPFSTNTLDDLAASTPTPDRAAIHTELQQRVQAALGRLSAGERTAFVLRHFEGMGIDDVSQVLGCQPGAAKHSVFRAVQKLRRALEPLVSATR